MKIEFSQTHNGTTANLEVSLAEYRSFSKTLRQAVDDAIIIIAGELCNLHAERSKLVKPRVVQPAGETTSADSYY